MYSTQETKIKQGKDVEIDNLNFYRARIYSNLKKNDNRLQVRPLPFLADIPQTEEVNLPVFPSFFSDRVVKGKSEEEDGKINADMVGILATPDFDYGFVLGLMNYQEGNVQPPMTNVFSFDNIKAFLSRRSCLPESFQPENIVVQHWHENFDNDGNSTGGLVEMYNRITGDKITLLTSGTVFLLSSKKIYFRVGAGDTDPLGGKKFSAIEMVPGKIKFVTPKFEVSAKKVKLGDNGLKCVGTVGTVIPTAVEGQPYIAVDEVTF